MALLFLLLLLLQMGQLGSCHYAYPAISNIVTWPSSILPNSEFVMTAEDEEDHDDNYFRAKELERITKLLLEGLGMTSPPDVSQMNITEEEMERGMRLYQQSVQESQRRAAREDDEAAAVQRFFSFSHTPHIDSSSLHERFKRSKTAMLPLTPLLFDVDVGHADDVKLRISRATLRLPRCTAGASTRVYHVLGPDTFLLDERRSDDDDDDDDGDDPDWMELDVTRALQASLRRQADNHSGSMQVALMIESSDRVVVDAGVDKPVLNVVVSEKPKNARVKRTAHVAEATDCKRGRHANLCCRRSMTVDFSQLKDFGFIIQPKQFDAYYCKGRCKARYNPAHDHALLQGIMHQQDRKNVPRPCCAPSKLDSLDILMFDKNKRNKLQVTQWKNMIVRECKCS